MSAHILFNPFEIVLEAYNALYQRDCVVQFVEGLWAREEAYGVTEFGGRIPRISVDVITPVHGAVEILAHELAHVAAGDSHADDHGEAWQNAFDAIHQRYVEIVSTLEPPDEDH